MWTCWVRTTGVNRLDAGLDIGDAPGGDMLWSGSIWTPVCWSYSASDKKSV